MAAPTSPRTSVSTTMVRNRRRGRMPMAMRTPNSRRRSMALMRCVLMMPTAATR